MWFPNSIYQEVKQIEDNNWFEWQQIKQMNNLMYLHNRDLQMSDAMLASYKREERYLRNTWVLNDWDCGSQDNRERRE